MLIETGTVVVGKYRLETELARGGMGSVWVARHVTLGSRVAMKFLAPQLSGSKNYLTRFEREARSAAKIDSPYVVHVQDFGVENGTPYLVMELLQGEDLGARLLREQRLSLVSAGQILIQAGRALFRAHEAGIIHRDLKPSNVFLARIEDDEVVKLLDFGIAKETNTPADQSTQTGLILGSPHYMSPEQAMGEKTLDHRSDLWSLSVVLYRMVTGVLPFPGTGMTQVLSKVLGKAPPKMAQVAPDLPAELDGFFAKALAKGKNDRFATIHDLMDAFMAIAAPDLDVERPSTHGVRLSLTPPHGHGPAETSSPPVSHREPVAQAHPPPPPNAHAHPPAPPPPPPSPDDIDAVQTTKLERPRGLHRRPEVPGPPDPATDPTSVTKRNVNETTPTLAWRPTWSFAAGVLVTLLVVGVIAMVSSLSQSSPASSATGGPLRAEHGDRPVDPRAAAPAALPAPSSTAAASAAASPGTIERGAQLPVDLADGGAGHAPEKTPPGKKK